MSAAHELLAPTDKFAQRHIGPDAAGQKAMLEGMMAQFRRTSGAEDHTESFVLSAQALLAAKRSIAERRVLTLETRFPFALG